jgi:TPR repeat protein
VVLFALLVSLHAAVTPQGAATRVRIGSAQDKLFCRDAESCWGKGFGLLQSMAFAELSEKEARRRTTRAFRYFARGCAMNDGQSCYWLATDKRLDSDEADRLQRKACDLGYQVACDEAGEKR